MEKYSAYRDPGTGIQPFLPLVPPPPDLFAKLTIPLAVLVGVVRTAVVLVLLLIYLLLVRVISVIFVPVPIVYRSVTHLFTAITARLALLTLGLFWISVDNVTRKRGRGAKDVETWSPSSGDIIVSNWTSWIELLWLAFRLNPIFILPVTKPGASPATPVLSSEAVSHTPGRRTGTGSANITATARVAADRVPVVGFRQVSLLSALRCTGLAPPFDTVVNGPYQSLEDIRRHADRPLVVFPECTTSNGRGLLRFANVFQETVPVRGYTVFVVCVRYDPPTRYATTLAHTIPSAAWNPLPHVFSIAMSLVPQAVSIRLLGPSESPSSQLFLTSEILGGSNEADPLADACGSLIAQIGKMKRTGMGWEDKNSFLELFHTKKKK
ncbi:hypothetical protein B0H10DRAFT_2140517 [Mycena sp. CBHHK59/15]|nr:hypothetical protein B0H10DRAFT_2140517 [Mycena sp. CBHHK59/15]